MTLKPIKVTVQKVIKETSDIIRIKFINSKGGQLPKFKAGAHIDLYLENNLIRQYSLCNNPHQRDFYEIAVLRESNGRGGSKLIHTNFETGFELKISRPRNNFPLASAGGRHILLAGGIGVTPMVAMIAELEMKGADYLMHYCTRSLEKTAFFNRLQPQNKTGKVCFHHDGGDPKNGFDIKTFLSTPEAGTNIYFCGPSGFMNAVETATEHWPKDSVHYEYFTNPSNDKDVVQSTNEFQIKIASSGEVFTIPQNKTIIEVLRENGLPVDTSCEDGYCGTCMTRFLDGEPEHRDVVLDDEDKKEFVLICCARSKTPCLVLDL